MPIDLGEGVTLHTRDELRLPPQTAPPLVPDQVTHGQIHYSTGEELGRDDIGQWWRDIDHFHRVNMGWENGLGYCWGAARDPNPERGHILEARMLHVGGHTYGYNRTSVGIVFLGDDDPDYADATPGARRALRIARRIAEDGLGRSLIWRGHRDVNATACPGLELWNWVHAGMPVEPYMGRPSTSPLPTLPAPVEVPPPGANIYDRAQPTLQRGSYGEQVVHLQRGLNIFSANLIDDGIFGRRTRKAVINFQIFWKLMVDGIYGPQTYRMLDAALGWAGY